MNEVVISGISGRFPSSNNMREFEYNLYNKIDMTNEDESRWKHFHPEVPMRSGKIQNLNKFDSSFFSVLDKQANWIDPQVRILLEHAYESILDAGISPQSLVGSRTGVFIGCCFSDSLDEFTYNVPTKEGYGVLGNSKFYVANRLSFALGLCGPSFTVDTACSSSAYALDCAYKYIMSGACDAAIVGGSQLILNLKSTMEYSKARLLSSDGKSCPFDESATGFTRAEAISCIFLQRNKDSKRVYAQLVSTSTNNDGFKIEGSTFPSRVQQQKLMEDFFKNLQFDASLVNFVEAHSTGTRVGDPEEVAAIDEVFCKNVNRKELLTIGSVKSNMGHAEASSAIASIAKVLLILERNQIAPNINLTNLRMDIPAFAEGRLRVATEVEDLTGPYISMNSFGLGGANAHALFKGNLKEKVNNGIPTDNLNRLVLWSGRTEEALQSIFNDITERPLDAEYIALLQNSQIITNPSNIYRGYGLFQQDQESQNAVCISEDIQQFTAEKRPIVFVYSGIGSQWCGMGSDLMNIPIFAETIDYCHDLLVPKGIDLKHIITSPDKSLFNNILNSYVGIISIEIALTNILNALGIKPDFIIGHSVGEMSCAYSDGCWTMQETILSAYSRGVASSESKSIKGAMAAIGLNYKDIERDLPSGIDIACHNGVDSSTISGPVEGIREYVKKLQEDHIFAKEVESSGLALHSRYIKEMGENLLQKLQELIKEPKKRSERWLSSSYPEKDWDSPNQESQYSSAEYHTKNLLNPVLFEEVTSMLPKNALTIEIAPHGLLKSILKRSMTEGDHLSLTQRNCQNGTNYLMEMLGRLFQNGVDLDIQKLYPLIQYPVSRGTPMISPLIKWNHSENHYVSNFDSFSFFEKRTIIININDKEFEFLQGHIIDGKVLYPATGWLCLVWKHFAFMMSHEPTKLKVIFEDVKFLRATSLPKNEDVIVTISIHRGSGRFEIVEGKTAIVNGFIKAAEHIEWLKINFEDSKEAITLLESDFYKEMRLRGYYHQGLFRAVKEVRDDGLKGKIKWNSEWTTFMDCLIQFLVLLKDTRMLILPTAIRKLVIDPIMHLNTIKNSKDEEILFEAKCCPYINVIQAGGVEIHGFDGTMVNRRRPASNPILETYKFVPYNSSSVFSSRDAAKICVQIVLENCPTKKLVSVEIDDDSQPLSECLFMALGDLPLVTPEMYFLSSKEVKLENVKVMELDLNSFRSVNLVIKSGCTNDAAFLDLIEPVLHENGYIISKESTKITSDINERLQVIAEIKVDNGYLYLMQFKKPQIQVPESIIRITSKVDDWLEPLKLAITKGSVLTYIQCDDVSGIIGLINCIRKEPNGDKVRCVFIDDQQAPEFDPQDSFYQSQLNFGLVMNVYKNNQWGSYRHLDLVEKKETKPRLEHCYANCLVKGDLSTLSWLYGPLNIQKDREIINISYASLNFRDVMLATGKITSEDVLDRIQQQCIFGFEFSGTTETGRIVMGLGPTGAMATHYDASKTLLWDVPNDWSLEEAASVPLVYFTVYMAFFITIQIEKGKSILIHAGSGGVGLAAIQVALSYGLEVYTTVGSDQKREYLLTRFPALNPQNIGNSRDTSFEQLISVRTRGKGVDYVLNSLSADMLQASIRCLGMNGTFLEIGKYDIVNKTKIDMGHFAKRINFKAVFFDDIHFESEEFKTVHELVKQNLISGVIKPLKVNVFVASEIEQAFRCMGSGKHIGKVVLKIREQPNDVQSLPIQMLPRVYCDSNESFILVGGLGGFGLELADWLILRGCRKLIMSSSRGVTNGYQAFRIKIWKSYGVDVRVTTVDVTTKEGCEELLVDALKMGPVGGIFNLAVALRDGIFDNQTSQMFLESLAPKAEATKHLDECSRKLCPSLKHFVVFSSVSCGRGNAGQSNYGMANSIMERICERRHKAGLPAKAIQWGAIGDVGLLANLHEKDLEMEISGTLPQKINSCLEVLDNLLTNNDPIVASMLVAEKRVEDGKERNVIEAIMNIMGIRSKTSMQMDTSLSKLGIDSLISTEIQQILERDFNISLSSQELRSLTLNKLEKRANSNNGSKSFDIAASSNAIPEVIKLLLTSFGDEGNSQGTILTAKIAEDTNKKVLFFTGMEGMVNDTILNLGENIKCSTYVLQLGNCSDDKTLDEIFNSVTKDVEKLFDGDQSFFFIGYSFGSLLAIKFAYLLESKGKSGNILIIDGSPQLLNELFNQIFTTDFKVIDIQKMVLADCTKILFRDNALEKIRIIFEKPTYEEMLEVFLENAAQRTKYSKDFGHKVITGLINRIKIMSNVSKLNFPVLGNSRMILVKASESLLAEIEDDYGLRQYVEGNLEVKVVNGDHLSILNNPDLYNIINSVL